MIRAVLFDFDGVIVDTESPTYTSWRDAYKEFGVDLALEPFEPGERPQPSDAIDKPPVRHQTTVRAPSPSR